MSYKGSQKTNTRAHAITEDDYADDDEGYDRYQSYDYEGDYEDEELEEQLQDMKAEQEKGGETNIAQVAVSQDEKKLREQLAREKAEQDVANSEQNKKRLKEEADAAREFLIEEGIQVPEFSDESIIAMYKRIFNRRQAQQQDLMVVSSSVPSAEVNFEDMEVEFFVDSSTSSAAGGAQQKQKQDDDEEQPRKKKSVAAIVLPDEYPEQPAQVFVKNGRYLERFARAVLRNMSSSQYSYKPQHANNNKKADSPTKTNNNNNDDDDDDDLGMLESAKSSEPVFLSDVCRFIQRMVDLMYLPNSPLQAAVDEESSKQTGSSAPRTNTEEQNASASAEAGFVAGEIPEAVREQAFLNICSREWAALTADHFTLKAAPKAELVIQAKPKPKNDDTKDDDDDEKNKKKEADDEEELFQLRRRRCLTANKPKPKAKRAPRPVAVTPTPAPVREYYEANAQTTFLNRLTEANENNSEFFTFGTALNAPLTENICKLKNLRYLDLHGARLTAIPNQLQELRIEKLILGKNSLKSFPKAILGLRSLRILDLSWNSLTQIPSGVGKLTELRVLELSHNKIESLCSFEHLKKLEVLDVTDNNLSGLPAEVGNLKNLWLLHIRGNPMVQIPLDIYYKGIDEIKNFLSQSSTKNLPVPPSTINEDLGYLHLQIPGNEHLKESIFGGVVPEKYVPGAGDQHDDYSAVVGEEQSELEAGTSSLSRKSPLLSIYYREKKVEVTTDSTTGASSINTIVSETPRLLFKTFKWLLAARVPLLVEQEFSSSSSSTKFILPEPLHEVEANLFAAFVLAPSSPFIVTNFNENNKVACLRLVSQYTRERSRKNGLRHLSQSANEIIGFSESLAHWVPVCCGDDLAGQLQQVSANRQTDGDLEGTQDEITQHLNDVINQNKLLSNLAAAGESQDPDIVSFIVGEERQRFYGHKSLLALRSGFFRTLFLDNMSGNNSGEVVIDDVEPSVFAALITFLYTDSHGKKMTNDNVVDLLFLSARYEVPRLRAMSECMVGFNVEIENVCRVLQMAYFLQSQRLKEACVMFVVSNRFNVEVTADYQDLQYEIREEISEKIRQFKLKRK